MRYLEICQIALNIGIQAFTSISDLGYVYVFYVLIFLSPAAVTLTYY